MKSLKKCLHHNFKAQCGIISIILLTPIFMILLCNNPVNPESPTKILTFEGEYIIDVKYRDYDETVIYKAFLTLTGEYTPVLMAWKTYKKIPDKSVKAGVRYEELGIEHYPCMEHFYELSDTTQNRYISNIDSELSKY